MSKSWPKVCRRLNPQDFLDYEFPLPSKATQLQLRQVKAEVDA